MPLRSTQFLGFKVWLAGALLQFGSIFATQVTPTDPGKPTVSLDTAVPGTINPGTWIGVAGMGIGLFKWWLESRDKSKVLAARLASIELKSKRIVKRAKNADQKATDAQTRAEVAQKRADELAAQNDKMRHDLEAYTDQKVKAYSDYRHEGPDKVVTRMLMTHEAQIGDNTGAINTNIPVIKAVAQKSGVSLPVSDPVEPLIDEMNRMHPQEPSADVKPDDAKGQ